MKTSSFMCRLMSLRQTIGLMRQTQRLGLVSTSMSSQCFHTAEFPSSKRNGFGPAPRKQDHDTIGVQIRAFHLLKRIEESMPPRHCGYTRDKLETPLIRREFGKIGSLELGGVRYMGIGSFKGGGRSAEHELRLPTPKADGSKEKLEEDEREKFLESANQDVATRISDTEKKVRDSVESSQTVGGATTELQFGVQDGSSTAEAVDNAYEHLLKKSELSDTKRQTGDKGQSLEQSSTITDHDADNPHAEIASEVWTAMDSNRSHFLDDSDKVEFQGQEKESIMGISSRGPGESLEDESTGPGETVRETLDATRAENKSGSKARTPEPGVRVGNVPTVGASANETDRGDIPTLSSKQQSTGGETLDRAQQQYEKSITEFGLGGDQKLKADSKK